MTDVHVQNWLRQSISDEEGLADVAYLSIAVIIAVMLASVTFLCAMTAVSYFSLPRPRPMFDGQPLALGIAAILAAFGAPITALAAYMAATRRRSADKAKGEGAT